MLDLRCGAVTNRADASISNGIAYRLMVTQEFGFIKCFLADSSVRDEAIEQFKDFIAIYNGLELSQEDQSWIVQQLHYVDGNASVKNICDLKSF